MHAIRYRQGSHRTPPLDDIGIKSNYNNTISRLVKLIAQIQLHRLLEDKLHDKFCRIESSWATFFCRSRHIELHMSKICRWYGYAIS